MDRAHWRSPSFRGRSPHPRHSNPRFIRGDGGNFGTPRHYSPQWQQRSPSPYRYQNQQVPGGGGFSPQFHHGHHPYATSTPVHGGGRRPYFRGGGGGGRFNKRNSFGSTSYGKGASEDIDNWVSPEMWADPWRHLTSRSDQFSQNKTDEGSSTKFAESDFDVTSSTNASFNQNQGVSCTKLTESDLNVADDDGGNQSQAARQESSSVSAPIVLSNPSMKLDENEIDLGDDDDDDEYATDRVVFENEDRLLS